MSVVSLTVRRGGRDRYLMAFLKIILERDHMGGE